MHAAPRAFSRDEFFCFDGLWTYFNKFLEGAAIWLGLRRFGAIGGRVSRGQRPRCESVGRRRDLPGLYRIGGDTVSPPNNVIDVIIVDEFVEIVFFVF